MAIIELVIFEKLRNSFLEQKIEENYIIAFIRTNHRYKLLVYVCLYEKNSVVDNLLIEFERYKIGNGNIAYKSFFAFVRFSLHRI